MSSYYSDYCRSLHQALDVVEFTDRSGSRLDLNKGIEWLCELSKALRDASGRLLFCGNGASAAFASHMALDWTKNGGVTSQSFNDAALQTALVNDLGASRVFADPVRWYGKVGDALVTISSSGNSPNILSAVEEARKIDLQVVTFSGLKPDNRSRSLGDLNIYLPAKTYGVVECGHQILLHMWLDAFMGIQEWSHAGFQDMRETSE